MNKNDLQQQPTPSGYAKSSLSELNWSKEALLALVGILVTIILSFIGLAVKHHRLFGRLAFWRRPSKAGGYKGEEDEEQEKKVVHPKLPARTRDAWNCEDVIIIHQRRQEVCSTIVKMGRR